MSAPHIHDCGKDGPSRCTMCSPTMGLRDAIPAATPSETPALTARLAKYGDPVERLRGLAEEIDSNEPWPEWRSDRDFCRALADALAARVAAPAGEPRPFLLRAADTLAAEVNKLVTAGKLDARSPAGDALLDYAQERHGQGDDALSRVASLAAPAGAPSEALRGLVERVNEDADRIEALGGEALVFLTVEEARTLARAALSSVERTGEQT